jgi:hypothetical protein
VHLLHKHGVLFSDTLPLRACQGYDVVKKLEKVGSGGGTPSKEVLIADCGELPVA